MSGWPSVKAPRLFAAILRKGWTEVRRSGSHRTMRRDGWPDAVWAFHDDKTLAPGEARRVARAFGVEANDL